MSDPLAIYPSQMIIIELIEAMKDKCTGEPLGAFAAAILPEIQADREVLHNLAEQVGSGSSQLKEMAAWLAEKVARLKLGGGPADRLGTFEVLEFLEIGIHGK